MAMLWDSGWPSRLEGLATDMSPYGMKSSHTAVFYLVPAVDERHRGPFSIMLQPRFQLLGILTYRARES